MIQGNEAAIKRDVLAYVCKNMPCWPGLALADVSRGHPKDEVGYVMLKMLKGDDGSGLMVDSSGKLVIEDNG